MFDVKSASIKGPWDFARVRVLWQGGTLKAFDRRGVVLEVKSTQPKRRKGYLRSWVCETSLGEIILRGKCMTCGGKSWWRIMRLSEQEIWNKTW